MPYIFSVWLVRRCGYSKWYFRLIRPNAVRTFAQVIVLAAFFHYFQFSHEAVWLEVCYLYSVYSLKWNPGIESTKPLIAVLLHSDSLLCTLQFSVPHLCRTVCRKMDIICCMATEQRELASDCVLKVWMKCWKKLCWVKFTYLIEFCMTTIRKQPLLHYIIYPPLKNIPLQTVSTESGNICASYSLLFRLSCSKGVYLFQNLY